MRKFRLSFSAVMASISFFLTALTFRLCGAWCVWPFCGHKEKAEPEPEPVDWNKKLWRTAIGKETSSVPYLISNGADLNVEFSMSQEECDLLRGNKWTCGCDTLRRHSRNSLFAALVYGNEKTAKELIKEGAQVSWWESDQGGQIWKCLDPNSKTVDVWKDNMSSSISWQGLGALFAGFLASFAFIMLEQHFQFRDGKVVLPGDQEETPLPKHFHKGARLLVAKKRASCSQLHVVFRFVEVISTIVFPCVFMVQKDWWWWIPLSLTFVVPALYAWDLKQLLHQPALAFALPRSTVFSVQMALFLFGLRAVLVIPGEWNTDSKLKSVVNRNMNFVKQQSFEWPELPWPLSLTGLQPFVKSHFTPTWLDGSQVKYWTETLLYLALGLYLLALTGKLAWVSCQACVSFCQSEETKEMERKSQEAQEQEEVRRQQAMVKDLRMQRTTDMREGGTSMYVDAFFVALDMFSDILATFTFLYQKQYFFAFWMSVIFWRSLMIQVFSGKLWTFWSDLQASTTWGVRHQSFLDILEEERGSEAVLSLMLTSYSYLYCVTSVRTAVQISCLSILLSSWNTAKFIYERVDLNLVDEEEIAEPGFLEAKLEEIAVNCCPSCGCSVCCCCKGSPSSAFNLDSYRTMISPAPKGYTVMLPLPQGE